MAKQSWKVSAPQWHVDPVTGDITVTANVSVDGKISGEVSYLLKFY